jgi:hypothetical protein
MPETTTITHEEREERVPGEKRFCVCDQPWPCAGAITDAIARYVAKVQHGHRQHVSVNFPAPGICVSRCSEPWPCAAARTAAALDAVMALAAKHEHGALRWQDPLPVPGWIPEVRAAMLGALKLGTDA